MKNGTCAEFVTTRQQQQYIERVLQNRSPERAFENLDSQLNRIHNSISNMIQTTTPIRPQKTSCQQQQKEMSSFRQLQGETQHTRASVRLQNISYQHHKEQLHTTAPVRKRISNQQQQRESFCQHQDETSHPTAPVRQKHQSSLHSSLRQQQREISMVKIQCADLYRKNQEIRMELAAQRRKIERLCEMYRSGDFHDDGGRNYRRRCCHYFAGALDHDITIREGIRYEREHLNDRAGAFHLNSGNVRNDSRDLLYERGEFHYYDDELYLDKEIQTIFHKIHRLIQLL